MKEKLLSICSQDINWLAEENIISVINKLQAKYLDEPINIISYSPIGYISNLEAVSNFYDDDVLVLAVVICRSIIQGHQLQDGNKRF
nr:hypothetical protein [Synergistaceae bacterium]